MADILTEDEEHENVYRHLRVVIDETKKVFVQLLNFHLKTEKETYEVFIKKNAHKIYHFCYPDKCCQCQCQSCNNRFPRCTCPSYRKSRGTGKRVLFPKQLEIFLDEAGSKSTGHDPTYRPKIPHCCCPVNAALSIDNLDVSLARFLLLNFTNVVQTGTPERKALDDLVEMRNNFAHAAKSRMSNTEYKASLNTTKQLLVLAKVYGEEQETKDKLDVIGREPFNAKVCIDLLNTLLLQANADSDIKENVKELAEIVKELKTIVPKTEQTTPEFIVKDINKVTVVEGADACFEIWLKDKHIPVKWFKDDYEMVTDSDKMSVTKNGNIHKLSLTRCNEEDKGLYGVQIKDTYRKALLDVKDYYTRNLQDVNCIEGDNVTFDCEVLYSDMKAHWYKDGIKDDSTGKRYTAMEQTRHMMNIPCVEMNDSGRYEIVIHERRRSARLTVESYFTKHLEENTCTEGDTVNFVCEVIEDNTTAKWFLNDNEIVISPKTERETSGRQHKLTIVNARVSDSGDYSVIVNNSKRKATLKVEDYYTKNPKHVSCIEGDAVSLDCEVIFAGMEAQWYKDGNKIESTRKRYTTIEQKHHMLIIPCVEMNDGGRYEIDIQGRRRSAELRIEYYYTRNPKDVHCIEGDNVTFDCEVLYSDMKAQWYKDGIKYDSMGKRYTAMEQTRHTMNIPCVEMNDSGRYEIDIHERRRSARLTVESYFTKHLEDKTCTEGDTLNFVCKVIEDNTTAKWFLNDNEIVISPRTEREASGKQHKLTIVNARVSDSGEYSVIVNKSKRKATLKVEGYYTKNLKHVSCIEGDAVSLDCEVTFSGMEAQWYKDGNKIESTRKQYTTIEQKRHMLIIPCVEMTDSGRYEIDIQDRRRSAELRIESYFTKHFDEIKCKEGGTVNFVCEVIEENTTVNWLFNDTEIETSHRIKFETSGRQHKLTIVNARVSDRGEYSVIVKNSKRKATLHVEEDDKTKRAAILDDINKKTEKRFYIRVMIVGEHGVGKSCLLRRLLGEGIEGVESTDGIDIVVRGCKIRLSDGKWIFDADPDNKRLYATRIKRAMQQENVEYEDKTMEMTTIGLQMFPGPIEHSKQDVETDKQDVEIDKQDVEIDKQDVETDKQEEEIQISETAEDKPPGLQPKTFASEQITHNTRERKQTRQPTESLTPTRKITKVLNPRGGKRT